MVVLTFVKGCPSGYRDHARPSVRCSVGISDWYARDTRPSLPVLPGAGSIVGMTNAAASSPDPSERLTGRVALVTGAGSPDGIGYATARRLAALGATVGIVSTTRRIHDRASELGVTGFV